MATAIRASRHSAVSEGVLSRQSMAPLPVRPRGSRRTRQHPLTQRAHLLPDLLEVGDVKSSSDVRALGLQGIMQTAGIAGTTVRADYKPILGLIPDIPRNCGSRDQCLREDRDRYGRLSMRSHSRRASP